MRGSAWARPLPDGQGVVGAPVLGQQEFEIDSTGVEAGHERRHFVGEALRLVMDGDDDGEAGCASASGHTARGTTERAAGCTAELAPGRYRPGHDPLPFSAVCRKAR